MTFRYHEFFVLLFLSGRAVCVEVVVTYFPPNFIVSLTHGRCVVWLIHGHGRYQSVSARRGR